ncbi:MAG: hypothetical protein ACRCUJ_14245 [Phocaeicola sp.]
MSNVKTVIARAVAIASEMNKDATDTLIAGIKTKQAALAPEVMQAVRVTIAQLVANGSNAGVNNLMGAVSKGDRIIIQDLVQWATVYKLVTPFCEKIDTIKARIKVLEGDADKRDENAGELTEKKAELEKLKGKKDACPFKTVAGKDKGDYSKKKLGKDKALTKEYKELEDGAMKNFTTFLDVYNGDIWAWAEFKVKAHNKEQREEKSQAKRDELAAERNGWTPAKFYSAHVDKVSKGLKRLISDTPDTGLPKELVKKMQDALLSAKNDFFNEQEALDAKAKAEVQLRADMIEYGVDTPEQLEQAKREEAAARAEAAEQRRQQAAQAQPEIEEAGE